MMDFGEMHKVRSPWLGLRSDVSGSVPLEFDEEDEDFLDHDNRLGVHGDDSISRPPTSHIHARSSLYDDPKRHSIFNSFIFVSKDLTL